jgi:hypothetical protein
MTTRSTQLAVGKLTDLLGHVAYTGAVNQITLLKRITYQTEPTSSTAFQILLRSSTAVDGYVLLVNSTITAYTAADTETWLALNPGDTLEFSLTRGTCRYWISGAVLPITTP